MAYIYCHVCISCLPPPLSSEKILQILLISVVHYLCIVIQVEYPLSKIRFKIFFVFFNVTPHPVWQKAAPISAKQPGELGLFESMILSLLFMAINPVLAHLCCTEPNLSQSTEVTLLSGIWHLFCIVVGELWPRTGTWNSTTIWHFGVNVVCLCLYYYGFDRWSYWSRKRQS